jgi:hypothetical protein
LPKTYKKSFISYTKQVWQPYYEYELTNNDAIEITNNMTDLVKLLIEWEEKDRKRNKMRAKQADQLNVNTEKQKGANHG